jgi:hypothetical protein
MTPGYAEVKSPSGHHSARFGPLAAVDHFPRPRPRQGVHDLAQRSAFGLTQSQIRLGFRRALGLFGFPRRARPGASGAKAVVTPRGRILPSVPVSFASRER